MIAFVAIVTFIARGYPLALTSRPETSLAVTPILDRPLSGDEPPVELAMVSPRSAAGEGVSSLILKGGPGGYEVTLSGDRLSLDLEGGDGKVPILTAKNHQGLAVATFGGTEVNVIRTGVEGPVVASWSVPEGVVTGLHHASEGLICISTVIGGVSYPETFPDGAWDSPTGGYLEEHLWFWSEGTWQNQPLILSQSVVVEGASSFSGDVLLLVDLSDVLTSEGAPGIGLMTLEAGKVGRWWPLQRTMDSGVMRLALMCAASPSMGPVLWTEREVYGYQVGGGEPTWTFTPPRGQDGARELTGVALLSNGMAIASARDVFFADREGEILSQIVPGSSIVTLFPLPGHPDVFVLLTEDGVSVYDAWAREIWSRLLDSPPLAWDTYISDEESAAVYLSVATADSLLQFHIDIDP